MINRMREHLKTCINKRDYIKRYSRIFEQCCGYVGIKDKHFHHIRHTNAVKRYLELIDI